MTSEVLQNPYFVRLYCIYILTKHIFNTTLFFEAPPPMDDPPLLVFSQHMHINFIRHIGETKIIALPTNI